jgi:hypothetical protein
MLLEACKTGDYDSACAIVQDRVVFWMNFEQPKPLNGLYTCFQTDGACI